MTWTSYPFGNFLSHYRAGLAIIALEFWIVFIFQNFYYIFNNINPKSGSDLLLYIVGFFIVVFNYATFDYNKSIWQNYNLEFDKLPRKTNILGGIIVWTIIFFITIIFFVSIHYSQKKFSIRYTPEFIAKKRKEDSLQKAQQIEKLKKIYGEDKK
ncbi:hypothetical protein [Chryseobacterium sp. EO14]|uniref:hypothetical protein n=1 Tax=Chryseobacterium sp. EO14 TaxID=2950551 RepID=UPI0021088989|nr:hypothetical protein [Chryseobacterium sp. EO14]MCQ4142531.1 hypothetical protein [Chryseobacterium sp. EO14]